MKKLHKILAFVLVLVLALSVLPMTAMAADTKKDNPQQIKDTTNTIFTNDKDLGYIFHVSYPGGSVVTDSSGKVISCTDGSYAVGSYVVLDWANATFIGCHSHNMVYTINRDGSFYRCSECGFRGPVTPHIDPKDAVDGRCTCGYKFMDNAQITTLWISGMKISPRFNRNTTEYTATLTRDIDEITKMTVRTFDAKATLELPTNLKLQKGENKLQFKVTAEDGKTTQTYTIIVNVD